MKAFHVCSWNGEYEQYEEDEHKYFLNEKSAKEYENKLDKEHERLKKDFKHRFGYDAYHGGSIFEEINIDE